MKSFSKKPSEEPSPSSSLVETKADTEAYQMDFPVPMSILRDKDSAKSVKLRKTDDASNLMAL